jgi:hypothetical protein
VHIFVLVLIALLALVCLGTAIADFAHVPARVNTITRLGLRRGTETQVAVIKVLATACLLLGHGVGLFTHIGAGFLTAYFLVAAAMHRRVRDSLSIIAVPLALSVVALVVAIAA